MVKKQLKKRITRKRSEQGKKQTPQKTRLSGGREKKPVRVKAAKEVEATKKTKKVPRKIRVTKKILTPKAVKTPKRTKVSRVVKTTKKVAIPKKVKTQKRARAVLPGRKTEEKRRAALRSALVKKREELVREAKEQISKYIRGETKQLVDTALDNGDWSVVDLSEDISLKQLSTHRETLLKVDEALRKIDEGTYGRCEDCGEDISMERLKVLPFAIYCVDCQEKREQLAELQRERRAID
jgi:RNA polymerase-binding transcription factor